MPTVFRTDRPVVSLAGLVGVVCVLLLQGPGVRAQQADGRGGAGLGGGPG